MVNLFNEKLDKENQMTYLYYVVGTAIVGAVVYLVTCGCGG